MRPIADKAYVSTTFEGRKPTKSLHFLDSGASDHFLKDRKGFTEYTAQPFRTSFSVESHPSQQTSFLSVPWMQLGSTQPLEEVKPS